ISHVRFERAQSVVANAHRSADAGAGTLFVDAVMSAGAFEIPAGSRVEVHGRSYVAAKVSRFEGFNGRVHHWEVELR
ncbi:MAG TPA: minor capsid protein, partial [Candidatus Olsenella avistercoris]|nr:minor capsid protein [Candidatus Olsenella avistercoris]